MRTLNRQAGRMEEGQQLKDRLASRRLRESNPGLTPLQGHVLSGGGSEFDRDAAIWGPSTALGRDRNAGFLKKQEGDQAYQEGILKLQQAELLQNQIASLDPADPRRGQLQAHLDALLGTGAASGVQADPGASEAPPAPAPSTSLGEAFNRNVAKPLENLAKYILPTPTRSPMKTEVPLELDEALERDTLPPQPQQGVPRQQPALTREELAAARDPSLYTGPRKVPSTLSGLLEYLMENYDPNWHTSKGKLIGRLMGKQ